MISEGSPTNGISNTMEERTCKTNKFQVHVLCCVIVSWRMSNWQQIYILHIIFISIKFVSFLIDGV